MAACSTGTEGLPKQETQSDYDQSEEVEYRREFHYPRLTYRCTDERRDGGHLSRARHRVLHSAGGTLRGVIHRPRPGQRVEAENVNIHPGPRPLPLSAPSTENADAEGAQSTPNAGAGPRRLGLVLSYDRLTVVHCRWLVVDAQLVAARLRNLLAGCSARSWSAHAVPRGRIPAYPSLVGSAELCADSCALRLERDMTRAKPRMSTRGCQ